MLIVSLLFLCFLRNNAQLPNNDMGFTLYNHAVPTWQKFDTYVYLRIQLFLWYLTCFSYLRKLIKTSIFYKDSLPYSLPKYLKD